MLIGLYDPSIPDTYWMDKSMNKETPALTQVNN